MLEPMKPQGAQTDPFSEGELERLKEPVQQYRICWEVWPEHLIVDGKKVQVGFELVLAGAHEKGTHPVPGCAQCVEIFQHLKEIAHWIVPNVERESWYDIQIFDSAIRHAPQRHLRPEVSLSIKILHRKGFDRPVDACEVRCLNEMQEKLKVIGAQFQVWNPNRAKKAGA